MRFQISHYKNKVFCQHETSVIAFSAHDEGEKKRTVRYIKSVADAAGVEVEEIQPDQLFLDCVLPVVTHKFDRWLAERFEQDVFEEIRNRLSDSVAIHFADGMKSARETLAYPEDQRFDGPEDRYITDIESLAFFLGFYKVMDVAKV